VETVTGRVVAFASGVPTLLGPLDVYGRFYRDCISGGYMPTYGRSSAKIAVALGISFGWVFVNGSVALLALTAFAFAH